MRTDLLSRFGADMGALQRDSENAQLRLQEELQCAKEEARNQVRKLLPNCEFVSLFIRNSFHRYVIRKIHRNFNLELYRFSLKIYGNFLLG